jgi:hypothetical protein
MMNIACNLRKEWRKKNWTAVVAAAAEGMAGILERGL